MPTQTASAALASPLGALCFELRPLLGRFHGITRYVPSTWQRRLNTLTTWNKHVHHGLAFPGDSTRRKVSYR